MKTNRLFLPACFVFLAASSLFGEVVNQDNNESANFIRLLSKAHVITVGEYRSFLKAIGVNHEDGIFARQKNSHEPILGISKLDAIRFCNWLENGCPTKKEVGNTALTSTETGSYDLQNDELISINPKARWHLTKKEDNNNTNQKGATTFAVTTEPQDSESATTSPLMMLGDEEQNSLDENKTTDTRGIEQRRQAENNSSSLEGSYNQAARGSLTSDVVVHSIRLTEQYHQTLITAASQAADQAHQNLKADLKLKEDLLKLPSSNIRTSKEEAAHLESLIHIATEASAIANMISSYVSYFVTQSKTVRDGKLLFPIQREELMPVENKSISAARQAAAWEATINDNLTRTKTALEVATKNYTEIFKKLERLKTETAESVHVANAALSQRASAISNVKAGALQTGSAAIGLAVGNPGPVVGAGVQLAVAGVQAGIEHMNVKKTATEVAAATVNTDYAEVKASTLEVIKNSTATLQIALLPLRESATSSLEAALDTMLGQGSNFSKEQSLAALRKIAAEEAAALKMTHAENLVTWANENLQRAQALKVDLEECLKSKQTALEAAERDYKHANYGKAKKELDAKNSADSELKKAQAHVTKSQIAIQAAEQIQAHAQSVLDALNFKDDFVATKSAAAHELAEAKKNKTFLECALHEAQMGYSIAKQIWKEDTPVMDRLLYPALRKNKDDAKYKRTECEFAVAKATEVLAQAEHNFESAAQDVANIDARLYIWDNLKAWHTVAIAANFQHEQLSTKEINLLELEKPSQTKSDALFSPTSVAAQSSLKIEPNKIAQPAQQLEKVATAQQTIPPSTPEKIKTAESKIDDEFIFNPDKMTQEALEALEFSHRIDVADKTREEADWKIAEYKALMLGIAPPLIKKFSNSLGSEMDEATQDALDAIEFGHRIDVADQQQERMKNKMAAFRAAKAAGRNNPPAANKSAAPSAAPIECSLDEIFAVNRDAQEAITTSHTTDVAMKTQVKTKNKLAAYQAKKAGLPLPTTATSIDKKNNELADATMDPSEDPISAVNEDAQKAITTSLTIDVAMQARSAMQDKLAAYMAKKNVQK